MKAPLRIHFVGDGEYIRGDVANAAIDVCRELVRKVEAGEARSVRSYQAAKAVMAMVEEGS